MDNRIKIVREYEAQSPNTTFSRYNKCKRFVDDGGNHFLETMDPVLIEPSENDAYHVVTAGDENRLDLIAYKYYGISHIWWVIAYANPSVISNPLFLPIGTLLRIPAREVVFGFKGILSY